MAEKPIFIPRLWRRMAAATRILLAAGLIARLGIEYGLSGAKAGIAFAAVYLCFSLAYAAVEAWHRGAGRLAAFGFDAAAFAVAALLVSSAWQVQLQYAFVLITVLLFHEWPVLAAAFALVAAAPGRLFPATAALMLLGALAMLIRTVLQDRLFQSSRQAVFHRAEAIQARSLERARLADDFHDGPLQTFAGLQVRLGVVKRMMEKGQHEDALREIGDLQEVWQNQVVQVRSFVTEVREGETTTLDAAAAVRRIAEEFEKSAGIGVRLSMDTLPEGDGEALLGLVLMVGEALQNVQKHSSATEVGVKITTIEGGVIAAIKDNGTGFPFGGTYSLADLEMMGAGPVSIRRRVRELGGQLTVESRPGKGSMLRIQVPV